MCYRFKPGMLSHYVPFQLLAEMHFLAGLQNPLFVNGRVSIYGLRTGVFMRDNALTAHFCSAPGRLVGGVHLKWRTGRQEMRIRSVCEVV
jgi:hypothetical protein